MPSLVISFLTLPLLDENGKLKIKLIFNNTLNICIATIEGVLSNIVLIFNFPSLSTEDVVEKRPLWIALEIEVVVLSLS